VIGTATIYITITAVALRRFMLAIGTFISSHSVRFVMRLSGFCVCAWSSRRMHTANVGSGHACLRNQDRERCDQHRYRQVQQKYFFSQT